MNLGLTNLRALVTAASRGLGAATARQLNLEGASVAICSRDQAHILATAEALKAESGRPVLGLGGRRKRSAQRRGPGRASRDRAGRAGYPRHQRGRAALRPLRGPGFFRWEKAFHLNLLSTVSLIRAALPTLRQSRHAAILTITSYSPSTHPQPRPVQQPARRSHRADQDAGQRTGAERYPDQQHHARLDSNRARRGADGRPRPPKSTDIETEIAAQSPRFRSQRMASPEEFAQAAAFLCSPAASYIHGAMIPVDGGAILASL